MWNPFTWFKKRAVPDKGPALSCLHIGICSKGECPLWLEMMDTRIGPDKKVIRNRIGKCSLRWIPEAIVECRDTLEIAIKLNVQTKEKTDVGKSPS